MDLSGEVAVVTGASRGIGRASAIELSRHGASIVVHYNSNKEEAQATLRDIQSIGGQGVIAQADVSNSEEVERMFKKIRSHFDRVDILVNNAGITNDGYLLMMSNATFNDVISTNLGGVFHCTRAALRIMLANSSSGRIVNISSTSGLSGQPGQANYSASKGAIISFTKAIAREYAGKGVRANIVAPGFISTDMTRPKREMLESKYGSLIPLTRFGEPEEIAKAVAFLASEDSSYITGSVLTVDGGLTI